MLLALLALFFGAGADTDAYFLALIVPLALGVSISEALYTSLLPIFTRGATLSSMLALALPASAAATAAYVAALLVLTPDRLAVWLSFAPILFSTAVGGALASYLVHRRRYAVAALRVALASALGLALAASILLLWRSVTGAAIGVASGHVLALALIAAATARTTSEPSSGAAAGRAPSRAEVLGPAAAVFFTSLVGGQLVVVLERAFATGLATGAVALLAFARGLALLPVLLPQALGAGVFPAAAARFAMPDRSALRELVVFALRLALLGGTAAAALVFLVRRDLVQIALERGELDAGQAAATARLVGILALSLPGVAASTLAARGLFAIGRSRLVAGLSMATVAVYAAVALALRETFALDGLAAAFSMSALAGGALMAGALARALAIPSGVALRSWIAVPILLGAAFGAGAAPTWWAVGLIGEGFWYAMASVAATTIGGTAALAVAAATLRTQEAEVVGARLSAIPGVRPGHRPD